MADNFSGAILDRMEPTWHRRIIVCFLVALVAGGHFDWLFVIPWVPGWLIRGFAWALVLDTALTTVAYFDRPATAREDK